MFGLIFILLIVVPIVELYVLFQVADSFGWAVSLGSLLAISLIGAVLVRWQTNGAFARVTDKIRQGEMPSKELVDGALMIFGGALLLTPGFFTDAFGLAMFIPPLRALARRSVLKRVDTRVTAFRSSATTGFGTMFTAGFPNGAGSGPGFRGGPQARRNDVIDVDEVHVERIDDEPASLPPTAHEE